MATANTTDEVKIQDLKVTDDTAKPVEATKPKKEKVVKPKTEKAAKPAKAMAAPVEAAAPVEELDFNRTPEEVTKALDQWTKTPMTYNQIQPNVKM